MEEIIDLENFPLHLPQSDKFNSLVQRCKNDLLSKGMFSLEKFMHEDAAGQSVKELQHEMDHHSFTHERRHNIYFQKHVEGLRSNHPALMEFQTCNHTLCADQLRRNLITKIYQWPPLIDFLAQCMGKQKLFTMEDPLARLNVMSYAEGMALNWHFDRSEFTTTLLLQKPDEGGEFEYRTDLRSADEPNFTGVARLLSGNDPKVQKISLETGTLNVFKGINTPHRVTPVSGNKNRIIAVFSYFDRPGVLFSEEERIGFYGRVG